MIEACPMYQVLGRNGKLSCRVPRQAPVLTDGFIIIARPTSAGIEVELYLEDERPRLIDVGLWMQGGYVRWEREKTRRDFNALDAADWVLRRLLPLSLGAVAQVNVRALPFGSGDRQSFNA